MRRVVALTCIFAALAPASAPAAVGSPVTCAVALVAAHAARTDVGIPEDGVGSSYLYVGGRFARDFGVRVRMAMPRIRNDRGLWYSNSIGIDDTRSSAFLSIGLMRWHHYGYRNEIALTWQEAAGPRTYRYFDTNLFVSNAPHDLGIAGHSGELELTVDGRSLCTAPERLFFPRTKNWLYYQIETEVSGYGDHPAGIADRIARKSDGETTYSAYRVHCLESGQGVTWVPLGRGRFSAAGVFDATVHGHTFTPLNGGTCRFVRY